jgi:CheY-like chemotaxis protein
VTDYFDKSLGFNALSAFIRGYVRPQTGGSGEVLYVEDSRVVAVATIRMLEKHGLTVRHVTSVEDAVAVLDMAAQQGQPPGVDVVLSDVNLKGDLYRRRSARAHPQPVSLWQGRAAGADHDRRRQSEEPGGAVARRRERPRAKANRRASADHEADVPDECRAACAQSAFQYGVNDHHGVSEHQVRLEPSWKARVGDYLSRPEMQGLSDFLRAELRAGKTIYPPPRCIFAALDATPFDHVKVVILGQDPYHGPGQAHGPCVFPCRPACRRRRRW